MTDFDQNITMLLKYLGIVLFYLAILVVPFVLFMIRQKRKQRTWLENQKSVLLRIAVPKENEKGPLAAEQMFASLHGIFRPGKEIKKEGSVQEHLSFEIATSNEKIFFYIWTPEHLRDFVEGQLYAQYPNVEISETDDYSDAQVENDEQIAGCEIEMNRNEVFPIKTFLNFEEVDPLSGITSILSKVEDPHEHIWIQILTRPVDDTWQNRGLSYAEAMRGGNAPSGSSLAKKAASGIMGFIGDLLHAAIAGPSTDEKGGAEPPRLTSAEDAQVKAIEEKAAKLGFAVKIKIGYISSSTDKRRIKTKLQSLVGAFKQFNTTNLNGFSAGPTIIGKEFLRDYRARVFDDQGYILNIEELASIFHLPNVSVETPTIQWVGSKKGEPPQSLPLEGAEKDLALFAETDFRHKILKFGIKEDDRRKHIYLIGKTGVGKSNMLEKMAIEDIEAGRGVAVVDPHGDPIESILKHIPPSRVNDVIVFNPADREYPIAFNPLESVDPDYKDIIASGLVGIFHKIWVDSWGPRMEYILRNTILSLLDYPNSTLMHVPRMYVDDGFRNKVIKKIADPVIKDFWTKEFASYNDRIRTEAVLPIQNKVGQFLSSNTIRNIVAQPKSKIDIRDIMDNKKILLIKLPQGEIGEDNSTLLGGMLITKIQLAAMSRASIPEEERTDFYLYVDEFQNFTTESFAKILSEARKYRLCLAVANQYINQLSETVRDAIFGNVGTLVSFRVGATDAQFMAKEFEPVFNENDLVNLDKFHIYVKLSIDGVTSDAFSAKTLKVPDKEYPENREKVINSSRERYSTPRSFVEGKIMEEAEVIEEFKESTEKGNRDKEIDRDDKKDDEKKDSKKYEEYLTQMKESLSFGQDNPQDNESEKKGKDEKLKNLLKSIDQERDNIPKQHKPARPDKEKHTPRKNVKKLSETTEKKKSISHLKTAHGHHKELKPGETVKLG